MLPTERQALWQNAKRRSELPEARAIIELIEASGLDYRANESVRLDDEIGRAMQKVVFSPEGRAAALEATEKGLPALAGVDPLLQDAAGSRLREKQRGDRTGCLSCSEPNAANRL